MSNATRLAALHELIDEEGPVDGIHNEDVRALYERGGPCPRYLGCASEGSGESSYRDNPDFFAGELDEVAKWLASSYEEGWAGNWVTDLEDPRAPGWRAQLQWSVAVQLGRDAAIPSMIATKALTAAANAALLAYLERLRRAEERGSIRAALGVEAPVELAVEIVNRALGRDAAELGSTRRMVGLRGSSAEAA